MIGGEGLSSKSMRQRLDSSSPQKSGSLPLNCLPSHWPATCRGFPGERNFIPLKRTLGNERESSDYGTSVVGWIGADRVDSGAGPLYVGYLCWPCRPAAGAAQVGK